MRLFSKVTAVAVLLFQRSLLVVMTSNSEDSQVKLDFAAVPQDRHGSSLLRLGESAASASRQRLLGHITQPLHRQQYMDTLPTHVMVKFIPIKIQDLNEKNEVLETTIRLQLTWFDPRLAWNPLLFYNVTEMVIPGTRLWTPDIGILNSVSDIYHVIRDTRFEMKVQNNGRIWWHPTGIVKTYCKLHLLYFPFDKQKCSLVLESPTLDLRFMNLTLRTTSRPVDTRMYLGGETWNLLSVSGRDVINRLGSKSTFSRVEFMIHVERARIYHILNVIFPAAFLSMVQLLFFVLPATHVQRVGSSTTTLLSVVVFHSVVVSQLPKTSTDVPLLAVYIFIVTFVSGISVCTSVLMAKFLVYDHTNRKIPKFLQRIPNPLHRAEYLKAQLARRFNRSPDQATATAVPFSISRRRPSSNLSFPIWQRRPTPSIEVTEDCKVKQNNPEEDLLVIRPEMVPSLGKIEKQEEEQIKKQRSPYLFNNWLDISQFIDTCLMLIAMTTAISSPIVMFVLIPYLAEDLNW